MRRRWKCSLALAYFNFSLVHFEVSWIVAWVFFYRVFTYSVLLWYYSSMSLFEQQSCSRENSHKFLKIITLIFLLQMRAQCFNVFVSVSVFLIWFDIVWFPLILSLLPLPFVLWVDSSSLRLSYCHFVYFVHPFLSRSLSCSALCFCLFCSFSNAIFIVSISIPI